MLKAKSSGRERIGEVFKRRTITPINAEEFRILRTDVRKTSGERHYAVGKNRRADGEALEHREEILTLNRDAVRGAAGLVGNNGADCRARRKVIQILVREGKRGDAGQKICRGNAAISPLNRNSMRLGRIGIGK